MSDFKNTFKLKDEFKDDVEAKLAYEYACEENELTVAEVNYIGAIVERKDGDTNNEEE